MVIFNYSNFAVNRDHSFKSKETRVITYTCRYFRGNLIPIIRPYHNELVPTRISACVGITLVFLFFITMIPIDCEFLIFLILVVPILRVKVVEQLVLLFK